jgi:hypothetical protein
MKKLLKNNVTRVFIGTAIFTGIAWLIGPDIRDFVESLEIGFIGKMFLVVIAIFLALNVLGIKNEYINN